MPFTSTQPSFSTTSAASPSKVTLTIKGVIGASSNSQLPPTTGQLWPRISQK